jgi:hypothetical protein
MDELKSKPSKQAFSDAEQLCTKQPIELAREPEPIIPSQAANGSIL